MKLAHLGSSLLQRSLWNDQKDSWGASFGCKNIFLIKEPASCVCVVFHLFSKVRLLPPQFGADRISAKNKSCFNPYNPNGQRTKTNNPNGTPSSDNPMKFWGLLANGSSYSTHNTTKSPDLAHLCKIKHFSLVMMLMSISQSLYDFSQQEFYHKHPLHIHTCSHISYILWKNLQASYNIQDILLVYSEKRTPRQNACPFF